MGTFGKYWHAAETDIDHIRRRGTLHGDRLVGLRILRLGRVLRRRNSVNWLRRGDERLTVGFTLHIT